MELPYSLLLLVLAAVAIVLLVKLLLLKKENSLLAQQLTDATISHERLLKSYQELKKNQEEQDSFQANLRQAGERSEGPAPIITNRMPKAEASPVERYRLIHSLQSRGLPLPEIAAILELSEREVEQVLSLARLRQTNP